MLDPIPLYRSFFSGQESRYISEAIGNTVISGDSVFSKKCQALMVSAFNAAQVLLTSSCTAALEMAAILCGVGRDDEVILPSFTFVSTANAFYLRGSKLIFADIRADSLNMDESDVARKISRKTKAIVPVHYSGHVCDMDSILTLARKRTIWVVEDAAHGVNAKYKGKFLGTLGDIGTYSFHGTKFVHCGEGGAIVINNEALFERAEIIRNIGTDKAKFLRGETLEYTWKDIGSSFFLSDICAAFLYAQLENMTLLKSKRDELYDYYSKSLTPLALQGCISLPAFSMHSESSYYQFQILVDDLPNRDRLLRFLQSRNIGATFHYSPLHLSPIGRSIGYKSGDLPVTESVARRLIRLPFYFGISQGEQARVVETIYEFFGHPCSHDVAESL